MNFLMKFLEVATRKNSDLQPATGENIKYRALYGQSYLLSRNATLVLYWVAIRGAARNLLRGGGKTGSLGERGPGAEPRWGSGGEASWSRRQMPISSYDGGTWVTGGHAPMSPLATSLFAITNSSSKPICTEINLLFGVISQTSENAQTLHCRYFKFLNDIFQPPRRFLFSYAFSLTFYSQ